MTGQPALCGALGAAGGPQVRGRGDKSCFYLWPKNSDSEELLDFTVIEHEWPVTTGQVENSSAHPPVLITLEWLSDVTVRQNHPEGLLKPSAGLLIQSASVSMVQGEAWKRVSDEFQFLRC